MSKPFIYCIVTIFLFAGCINNANDTSTSDTIAANAADALPAKDTLHCINPNSRMSFFAKNTSIATDSVKLTAGISRKLPANIDTSKWPPKPWPAGMVWVSGDEFMMGGVGNLSKTDEFPVHKVRLEGFWIDETEVTIAEYKQFVALTNYITIAEKKPEWEQLKKGLPPGTPPPPADVLVPGALVFHTTQTKVPLQDFSLWWSYVPGADWKHPEGPQSDVFTTNKFNNHPATQIAWLDAEAFANYAFKRLPTEAEWEFASRGGLKQKEFAWGDGAPSATNIRANLWEGKFPYKPEVRDGFYLTAPVASYAPNGYGIYDMMGNVWEWCSDWYRPDTYAKQVAAAAGGVIYDPKGPDDSYDPDEPYAPKRVTRGGSFLCTVEYCASYRPAARMKSDPYTGQNHTGFRCVMSDKDWRYLLKKNGK